MCGALFRVVVGFFLLTVSFLAMAQPANTDCPVGEFLCTKDDVVVPDRTGDDGAFEEIPSCFGSGEISSDWYIFTAATSGSFSFELNPNTPTDFNWSLYNITGGPAPTCDYGDEIACNSASTTGITGIGCAGAACDPTMMLTAGDTYALLINRLSAASGSGYTLSFGGTVEFGSPVAEIGDVLVCTGQEVEFENQGSGNCTYYWTFGDGTSSTEFNPELSYDMAGIYTVTLVVTADPGGCFSEATATVTVSDGPELVIEPAAPVICAGESVPLDLTFTLTSGDCTPLLFEMDEGFEIPAGPSLNIPIHVTGVTPLTFSPDMLVSVCVDIVHDTDAELDISLQCPDGTIIELSTDNGGSGNNYTGTCFVATGAPAVTGGTAPFTGSYTPEGSFSDMSGCTVNGNWYLIVDDDTPAGELGSLEYWSISFACENLAESIIWTPATGLSSTAVEDPIASPLTTTTYTVTVTEFSGCSASTDVTVTVVDAPIAGFYYSGSPYCSNASNPLPILDPGASSGIWSASPSGLIIDAVTGEIDIISSAPGIYTITNYLEPTATCPDATATFPITIVATYAINQEVDICSGEEYILPNGVIVNSPGEYITTLISIDGCDSIITTILTVLPVYSSTEDIEICDGGSYTLPDGSVATTAGTYISNLTTISGCDSVITTNITLNTAYSVSVDANICEGELYSLPDGTTTSAGGTYTTTLISTIGCDSIITTTLTVDPAYSSTENIEICDGGSYTLPDGSVATTAGTYISNLTTISGCDSVITTNITLNTAYSVSVDANICEGELYSLPDGTTTTTSGTYTTTLISTIGCDSIITTTLTVNTVYSSTEDIEICDGGSYTLPDGTIVTTAGTYISNLTTIGGCDSIITTTITLSTVYSVSVDANICDGEVYILPDGTATSAGGTYTTTLISTIGCDSIITTTLTVNTVYSSTEDIEICDGGSYILPDGTIVTTAGTYISNLTTIGGCDSIITTTITLSTVYSVSVDANICDGEVYILPDGTTTTTSGTYTTTLVSTIGCDSIITTTLIVNTVYSSTENIEICEGGSYTLPDGSVVAEEGIYVSYLTSIHGCDSSIFTIVSIVEFYSESVDAEFCAGDTYLLPDGSEVTSAGSYSTTLISIAGCDSLIETNLVMLPIYTITIDTNICGGETYTLPDGIIVSASGSYTSILSTIGACDSIVNTELNVLSTFTLEVSESICDGETYTLPDGTNVSSSGAYTSVLTSINGCDSIILTNLNVIPVTEVLLTEDICTGTSYVLPDGSTTSVAGTYTFSFISTLGCDSNVTLILDVLPLPLVTLTGLASAYCTNTDPVTLLGEPAGGIYTGDGISGDMFFPELLIPGLTYTINYAYTDVFGCTNSAIASTYINPIPVVTMEMPEQFCIESESFTVSMDPPGGVLSGSGITGDSFTPGLAGVGGPYSITYTYTDANGCIAQQEILVTVIENTVDAGPDQTINLGDSIYLNVTTSGTINWTPETGLSCTDCTGVFASPQSTIIYTVTSIDASGCIAMDEITIFVNPYQPDETIFVPSAFTPNSDGLNDYFFVYGPDIDFIETLQIFDRWGVLMFSKENIQPEMEMEGWDGTFAGKEVNAGVYAWSAVIRLKGNKQIHQYGNVTLLR